MSGKKDIQTNEHQTTQSEGSTRDREIHEKSVQLRIYSNALLQESRDLCMYSRKLRTMNRLLAVSNANPNLAGKLDPIRELHESGFHQATCLRWQYRRTLKS